jgi:hypothetical protein
MKILFWIIVIPLAIWGFVILIAALGTAPAWVLPAFLLYKWLS